MHTHQSRITRSAGVLQEMSSVLNCFMYSAWDSKKPCMYRSQQASKGAYANLSFGCRNAERRHKNAVRAFFANPTNEPVLKEALKEPVAFLGGVFVGVLSLDLNEDPLKEWLTRTVEASNLVEEDLSAGGSKQVEAEEEDGPQQIEIE